MGIQLFYDGFLKATQWGQNNSNTAITYPIEFPTLAMNIWQIVQRTNWYDNRTYYNSESTSGFNLNTTKTGTFHLHWLTLGY